jgi:hypothetical protein
VRSGQQPIRPLPVILPPLTDELLSSWINRHAAFIGVSGMRLLRHYRIDVPTVRDLDLELSRCDGSKLAEALRWSPQVLRNMTQSRGGRVRSGLLAIRQPTQICRPCAVRHSANSVTRNARLRSWMEGWRITCPICGTELEDFRLYTRLFRADPADALLMQIKDIAREGEQKINRSSMWRGGTSTYARLMRGLLLPQASRTRPRDIAATIPRLLDLVVRGADDFFGRIALENWPCTSRMLPLSVRIPVLAGVATVSGHPENWIGKLISAAAPPHRANLRNCLEALPSSYDVQLPNSTSPGSGYCGNIRNLARGNSDNKWQPPRERALFR